MQEYVSEGVVLDHTANGDLDGRVSIFTRRFGKLIAKSKSTKKITSKLNPHLQPGNVVRARFVEKGGLQVVDVLKERRLSVPPPTLHSLHMLLADAEPDHDLWRVVTSERFSWPHILRILGWDPEGAACMSCGTTPAAFHVKSQEFFCAACASNFSSDAVILLE